MHQAKCEKSAIIKYINSAYAIVQSPAKSPLKWVSAQTKYHLNKAHWSDRINSLLLNPEHHL